jgi:hypothetical protein
MSTMFSVQINGRWLGRTSFQRLEVVARPFRYLWETREDAMQALLTFAPQDSTCSIEMEQS